MYGMLRDSVVLLARSRGCIWECISGHCNLQEGRYNGHIYPPPLPPTTPHPSSSPMALLMHTHDYVIYIFLYHREMSEKIFFFLD